ncbi:uncharacterized protein BJ171DRAFT_585795 [Polychytrium aggregatum]|uniref:uncharacterized protein n=1 Tax=Polychytrium aggregatum TaxID=110093 RepID=UPI0022FF1E90|nr:uncharacterized protein BJ171DRAFT_585795 [Polychytrium aggregatum]KAI9197283.1 hypothetical protein BJ171DRAFT_585795 [Polychytrium aggregatum]
MPQHSSLPLQIAIYFNQIFAIVYLVVALGFQIYKGYRLPYPSSVLGLEIFGLFALTGLELARLSFGSRGNKTEEPIPLMVFLGMTPVAMCGFLFYFLWQAYVLIFDVALNSVMLAFLAVEFFVGIWEASILNQQYR